MKELKKNLFQQYLSARIDLFLLTLLTFINILMTLVDTEWRFPFSVSFPTFATLISNLLNSRFGSPIFFYLAIAAGVVCVGIYLLLFFLSKRKFGCMVAVNILYGVDFIFCLFNFFALWSLVEKIPIFMAIDILLHLFAIYYLIIGWRSGQQLLEKYGTLTPDPAQVQADQFGQHGQANAPYDPNRPAQTYGQAPQSPYGQPYGQTPQSPYGQPYGQTPQSPYGQAPQAPYGQPYGQSQFAQPEQPQTDQTLQSGTDASGQSDQGGPSQS